MWVAVLVDVAVVVGVELGELVRVTVAVEVGCTSSYSCAPLAVRVLASFIGQSWLDCAVSPRTALRVVCNPVWLHGDTVSAAASA